MSGAVFAYELRRGGDVDGWGAEEALGSLGNVVLRTTTCQTWRSLKEAMRKRLATIRGSDASWSKRYSTGLSRTT